MSDALSYQPQETVTRLENIAAGIFARYGVDFASAKRASGWSNATWLAGGLALSLAFQQGNEKVRREAMLGKLLPPETGYPAMIETGETEGYEWALSKEIPGKSLRAAWPGLNWDERTLALRQLWQRAEAVHSVDRAAAAGLARTRAWFNSNDCDESAASLRRLAQQGLFNTRQLEILGETLDCFWQTLPAAACVLNHGDLTLDNALWHQGQLVSLLDFEFALIAPAALDLNTLLKVAIGPEDGEELQTQADALGQQQIRQAAVELAQPVIAQPGGKALLSGYAILLELWLLEDWLAHPEGEGPIAQWDPYLRLLSLADGQAGYLAPVLRAV